MEVQTVLLSEAVNRYVATLSPKERDDVQQELGRFARWFGGAVRLDQITAVDVESYQEHVEKSGAVAQRRLEPLKTFLAWAQRERLIDMNLAKFIKLRRTATRRDSAANARPLNDEVIQLTAEGHRGLQEELEYLITVKRPEISRMLYEARLDKDIRENAPFDAAKQHQGEVEARIREIEAILARAQVVEPTGADIGRVGLGSKVVLRDMAYDEEISYMLVGPNEANPRAGRISIASPVGKALLDRHPGEVIEVDAPAGKIQYRLERIEQ